jgi:hypothetical protein
MGVVHEAIDHERGLRVALKLLTRLEPDRILRFKDEFRALRDLHHPNLVSLGDLVEDAGTWLFTMELVNGVSFLAHVRGRRPPPSPPSDASGASGAGERVPGGPTTADGEIGAGEGDGDGEGEGEGEGDGQGEGEVLETLIDTATQMPSNPDLRTLAGGPLGRQRTAGTGPGGAATSAASSPASGELPAFDVQLRHARFDEVRLRQALRGLTSGLWALHRAGKVHRDVKPSNILVEEQGRTVLLDFGVVAELSHERAFERGQLIGTITYMAPEQASGSPIGPAADWYAVGTLIYEVLTGRAPFAGDRLDVIVRKCRQDPTPPSRFVSGLPVDLEELCLRLLSRQPEERPDGAEILRCLQGNEAGERTSPTRTKRIFGTGEFVAVSPFLGGRAPVFVGRAAELGDLDAAFRSAREGQGRAVMVIGESGIGKTALVQKLVAEKQKGEPRLLLLQGRCHEREQVPYNALDGVIDRLSRHLQGRSDERVLELIGEGTQELLHLFPALRTVPALQALFADDDGEVTADPGGAAPRRDDGQESRARGFAALKGLLARLAERRPVLLVVEDLQWADADSCQLLGELIGAPAPPLLILCTYRVGPGHHPDALPAGLGLHPELGRLPLGGLRPEDSGELLSRLATLHRTPLPAETAALLDESGGHPMFLDEVVQRLAEAGPGEVTGTRAVPEAGRATPVRLRVDEAIRHRAAQLPPAAHNLLELLAVAGGPVPHAALAAAADLAPEEYAAQMALLLQGRFAQVSGARQTDTIDTYHDRVREALLAELADHGPASPRAERHALLANALEGSPGVDPGLLYDHLRRGGQPERAAQYLDSAIAQARSTLAFGRVARLLRQALDSVPTLPPGPAGRRLELLIALAEALDNDGRPAESAATYLLAAAETADSEHRLDLSRRAAQAYLMGGHLEDGLRVARTVLGTLGMTLPESPARILGGIAWNQLRMSVTALSWPHRRDSEVSADARARIDLCWSMGAGLSMVNVFLGGYFSSRGALLALEHGDPFRIGRALASAAISAAAMGRIDRARGLLGAARRAAAQDGTEAAEFYARLADAAAVFLLDNDWRAGHQRTSELLKMWRAMGRGQGWETDVSIHFNCSCLQMMGDWRELRARVAGLVAGARRAGNRFLEVSLRVRFAMVHLFEDRAADALADLDDALASWATREGDTFGNQRMWALWSRTRIALYERKATARRAALEEEWRHMQGSLIGKLAVMQIEWRHAYGTLLLGLGVEARLAGRPAAEVARYADQALDQSQKLMALGFPICATLASLLRAGAAGLRGQKTDALTALVHAERLLRASAMDGHAACVQHLQWRLTGTPGPGMLQDQGIAKLVAEGIAMPSRLVDALVPGFAHFGAG